MPLFSLPMVLDLAGKATVILAVTGLVAASLRRASASARHFVWTLGLASALIAPALTIALPRWELPIVHVSAPVARSADASLPSISNPTTSESEAVRNAPPLGRATRDMTAPATPSTAQSDVRRPAWPTLALFAWILGAAAILARMLIGLAAVQWMSRRTPEVSDAPWLAAARAHADALGLLVPADADTWPAHRVRVVLLHELAHVKRRDCLTHLVAQIACAAYWFNPLAWVAARRLRSERERACDDLVLAAGTRGSDYADQLLDIARVMNAGRFPAVLAGASLAMARRSQLEGRLIAILDPSVARRGLTRARAVAAATMFAIIIMAVASVQPWAEERAAVNASVADASAAPQPQIPPRPVVSTQDAIQGAVQGAVQGTVQGQVQGEIQGRTHGAVTGGVSGGIAGGVTGGVIAGVAGGIATAVTDAIVGSVAGVADEVAGELRHEFQKERIKERDKDSEQGRVRDPRTVNALMEALKDTDKDVRETAMNALVQMRDPRLFEPLVTALKDASADVREHAAFGLGQMRDARAIDPLTAALKDQSADVREQVVFALGQLRAVAAIDPLAMALHDAAADVREQAAFALGQIRDRRAVEPLISALKDEKPDVREQAAFALGQMRDAKAIEALVIALKDSNADVRAQVAFALGRIGDPRAIDGLTAALKDASAQVRQQAAFALGQIR